MFKYAYSNYFKSHIKCVLKLGSVWFFHTVDKSGKKTGKIMRSGVNYDFFDWKDSL